jgi:hypothetical protein
VKLLSVNCQWSLVIFTEAKETIKHIVDEITSKGYCKAVAVTPFLLSNLSCMGYRTKDKEIVV